VSRGSKGGPRQGGPAGAQGRRGGPYGGAAPVGSPGRFRGGDAAKCGWYAVYLPVRADHCCRVMSWPPATGNPYAVDIRDGSSAARRALSRDRSLTAERV